MSTPPAPEQPSPPKKLRLEDLIPPRVPVQTSKGEVYARSVTVSDLTRLDADGTISKQPKATVDTASLGRLAVHVLVAREKSGSVEPAFSREEVEALPQSDLQKLAEAVASACKIELTAGEDITAALGSALHEMVAEEQGKKLSSLTAKLPATLARSFSGMPSIKLALEEQLKGIASLRDSLRLSPAVEAMLKAQDLARTHQSLVPDSLKQAAERAQRDSAFPTTPDFVGPPPVVVDIHQTPLGRSARASEEAAAHLRDVAGMTAQLAAKIGELSELVVAQVLPRWFDQLKGDAEATRSSASHAEKSLWWAKWAIVASVAVSGGQLCQSWWYNGDNDQQQKVAESLLRGQLEEAKKANETLEKELQALREAFGRLEAKLSAPTAPASQDALKAKTTRAPQPTP